MEIEKKPSKNTTPESKPSSIENEKKCSFVTNQIFEIYIALGQTADLDRIKLYSEALNDLTMVQLQYGFATAKRNLGDFLPSIAQLREWSEMHSQGDDYDYERRNRNLERIMGAERFSLVIGRL